MIFQRGGGGVSGPPVPSLDPRTSNDSSLIFWAQDGFANFEPTYVLYHPTNFSTKYLVMFKVYSDVGGIKLLYHDCPPVRKIIHSLKLVVYLHVQADDQPMV